MSADEQEVKAVFPDARIVWDSESQRFKVYRKVGECSVALSSSWETASMAWYEAAKLLREKIQVS